MADLSRFFETAYEAKHIEHQKQQDKIRQKAAIQNKVDEIGRKYFRQALNALGIEAPEVERYDCAQVIYVNETSWLTPRTMDGTEEGFPITVVAFHDYDNTLSVKLYFLDEEGERMFEEFDVRIDSVPEDNIRTIYRIYTQAGRFEEEMKKGEL